MHLLFTLGPLLLITLVLAFLVVGGYYLWSIGGWVAGEQRVRRFLRRCASPPQAGDGEILAVVPASGEVAFEAARRELTVRLVAQILPYTGGFGCGLDTTTACRIRATALLEDALRRGVLALRVEPAIAAAPVTGKRRLCRFLAQRLRRLFAGAP